MENDPDVDDAYAMSSAAEVKALYRTWSHSYDTGFHDGQGYQLPRAVAMAFQGAGGQGPILDVGAGTGLVGAHLATAGIGPIDGIDLSDEMLQVAAMKGHYRTLQTGDVTTTLDLPAQHYNGIVSAGTFTLGHVGPAALENLLPVAAPGALFVISVNSVHFDKAGFGQALNGFGDRVHDLTTRDIRIYDDRADDHHRNDMARLISFRKA